MSKEIMRRAAADNAYLHKDFHGALNVGLAYLEERYGAGAVREYLRRFTLAYHAPLREELMRGRLEPLRATLERIYRTEGASFRLSGDDNELRLELDACPAVTHLRTLGAVPAPTFVETTRTVNEALCEGTPFTATLTAYDPETGAGVQRFFRSET